MIVTRTPLRLPLGGGGTDLASYYRRHGGFLVSAAINKYVDLAVNQRFEDSFRISYSQTEIVDRVEAIKHPIVRCALQLARIERGLEVVSIADVPSNTGLGTSSSFTVGLLKALHTFKREDLGRQELAEEACRVEIEMLGEPIGKQDQYLAAFGGVTCLEFSTSGDVKVTRLELSDDALDQLESNTLFFYTGIRRSASEILQRQNAAALRSEDDVVDRLHRIKEIGYRVREALEGSDIDRFGSLMHEHWLVKRGLSRRISDPAIDGWYELARQHGALGGKVVGAGGGGFLVVYCNRNKSQLRAAMAAAGLREVRFRIDTEGCKVLINS
jgi:D-glycero-alpha-D-manno-heptose-7-phosphate kinase